MSTKDETPWTVVDLNAKTAPRTHEVPIKMADGEVVATKTYRLESEKPTEMPQDHAMFFLKDSAFIVRDGSGEIQRPVVKREGGLGGFELGENEVIAEYDELSKEALFKRCKTLAGSEHIKETRTPKEDMIEFLKARAKPPVGEGRAGEGKIGEMSVNEVDTILRAA